MSRVDEEAVSASVRATADDLLRYFERRVRDREDAADLLAETLLQVWRRADRHPGDPEGRGCGCSPSLRTCCRTRGVLRRALVDVAEPCSPGA